jgi:putative DNA primase/helicase
MMTAESYTQILRQSIPAAMRQARRWLLWRLEDRAGVKAKVPYYASGERRQGTLDTQADWSCLVDFETALKVYESGRYTGLGFALGPDESGHHWQGIDLDHIANNQKLKALADSLPGYVETSPSGDGLHAIGCGLAFRSLGSNDTGIEAYSKGRYFTVTGRAIRGDIEDVAEYVNETLAPLHSTRKAGATSQHEGESFFAKVNTKAMGNFRAWVPALFPKARDYHDGYRVASKDLGRNLEEDISIVSQGIKDFGEERAKTPLDLVVEWGAPGNIKDAAMWLCQQMQIDPASLGWNVVDLPTQRDNEPPADVDADGAENHFRPLGYDGDTFYFMTARGQQVRALTANKLGRKTELMTLAPLDWWEHEFSEDAGFSGRSVDMAANFLIQRCLDAGVFALDRRRGRGVWRDGDQIVIHAGDRLYVDGKQTPLMQAETECVYERQSALPLKLSDPLPAEEARALLQLGELLNFETNTMGRLLAGWVVVALASGALTWRPHVLLIGGKGTGKTTILSAISALLAPFGLSVTGGTTEAGLRQALGSDALPVLFDEAEGDSQKSLAMIEGLLSLMRHSSAGHDARVIKGGADGKASASVIQSCFLLSAIRDPVSQAADQSRITSLSLRKGDELSTATWKRETQPLLTALTRQEWVRRFHARVLRNLPMLLDSIEVYRGQAAAHFHDARMGDQIGTLLAGARLLESDQVPSDGDAIRDIDTLPWDDQEQVLEDASDEAACLRAILEAQVRLDAESGWHGDITIGELVAAPPIGGLPHLGATASDVQRALGMYGLKVDHARQHLLVSNTNGVLARKVMAHTPWPKGWGKILARLEGAVKPDKPIKIQGYTTRAVAVPIPLD